MVVGTWYVLTALLALCQQSGDVDLHVAAAVVDALKDDAARCPGELYPLRHYSQWW